MIRKKSEIILFIFLFESAVFCANDFMKASGFYVRGNFKKAEELISAYIKQNPGDKKASALYQKICLKLGEDALSRGDDATARTYAQKAYEVNPSDSKVRNFYLATKKVKKAKVTPQKIELKKMELTQPALSPRNIASEAASRRPKIVKKVEYKTKTEYRTREVVKEVKKIPDWIFASIVLNLALAAGLYLLYKYKFKKRNNRAIYANYLKSKVMLAGILKNEAKNVKKQLGEDKAKFLLDLLAVGDMPEEFSIKFADANRAFTDINPAPRLTADMIELAEVLITKPRDAVKFITPYLEHPNNRVRANAAKAIYKHKPAAAVKTLSKMASSDDRWQRLSAVWACGQIGKPDTQRILKKLADDGDVGVALAAEKALKENEKRKESPDTKIQFAKKI
ncbi:MAG: HEAT repeat domain-containing protein [Elusimicrobia bacterium]|nr:HEAT repeat domain-containing protein [Elusimicrobiota bacterium]